MHRLWGGDAVSRQYMPRFDFTGGEIILVEFNVAEEDYLYAETRLAVLLARDRGPSLVGNTGWRANSGAKAVMPRGTLGQSKARA